MDMTNKLIRALLVFLIPAVFTVNHAFCNPVPKALLTESLFTFKPVWEGDMVSHEFIVKNKGTGALEILKVESG